MTVRQNVHQLIESLPDDRLADLLDYLNDLTDSAEPLSAETRSSIEEGLADIRNDRIISLAEFKKARGM